MKEKNTGVPINQDEIYHYLKDIRKILRNYQVVLLILISKMFHSLTQVGEMLALNHLNLPVMDSLTMK